MVRGIKNLRTRRKLRIFTLITAILGAVGAVIRYFLIDESYNNGASGLYMRGMMLDIFTVFCIASFLCCVVFASACNSARGTIVPKKDAAAVIFSETFAAFSFLACAIYVYFSKKTNGEDLVRLDAALIVFFMFSAVAFFSKAFGNSKNLTADVRLILALIPAVACLLICFYFYFDVATVVHDSNKKLAIMTFCLFVLAIMTGLNNKLKRHNNFKTVAFNLMAVYASIMYSLPNIVWYFAHGGDTVFYNVITDVLALALGVCFSMCMLFPKKASNRSKFAVNTVEKISVLEKAPNSEEVSDTNISSDSESTSDTQTEDDIITTNDNEISVTASAEDATESEK